MARDPDLEAQIEQWRGYVQRRPAMAAADVAEMEDHLRERVADLVGAGLSSDEAFLVAVKRMGSVDEISREFAREHSDRLWKQLVLPGATEGGGSAVPRDLVVALGFASAAAVAVRLAWWLLGEEDFVRNAALMVLPFLTANFAWKRALPVPTVALLLVPFVVVAGVVNGLPFEPGGSTEIIAMVHAPIALWLVVGFAYVGGE